jgi:hypothetical protein
MPDLIPVRAVKNGAVDYIEQPTQDELIVEALLRERAGYLQYRRHDDAAQVDAELARLGYVEPTPEPTTDEGATDGRGQERQRARRRPAAGGE